METRCLDEVVRGIDRALRTFPELDRKEAVIAFSGGKDSIALAVGLQRLGRSVRLRAVDMDYTAQWHDRIKHLAAALGMPVEILRVKDLIKGEKVDEDAREDLTRRRAFLDQMIESKTNVTPCTNCYNCKILSLVHGGGGRANFILFAHHADDVISSFLKSALMFYDRWEEGNVFFDRVRFLSLCKRLAVDFTCSNSEFLGLLLRYLHSQFANTSEPPLEDRLLHGVPYSIGRPLFFVRESDTASLVRELGFHAESSGCGHTLSHHTRTPREIIHYEVLPFVRETDAGRRNLKALEEALVGNLLPNGRVRVDVRSKRHLILGKQYKGGIEDLADRL